MEKMKILGVVLGALLFASSEAKVNFNIYEDECIKELNVNKEAITAMFSQDWFPEDNQDFKNVLACSWQKEGIIDENGNMVIEKFRQFLVDNFRKAEGSNYLIAALVAADTIHHCEDVKGGNAGETAVKMSNCVLRRLDSYDD